MARPHLAHVSAQLLVLSSLCREYPSSLCDEPLPLRYWKTQNILRTFGEFFVDERGCAAKKLLQLRSTQYAPVFESYPVGPSQVGRRDDAFRFEELMKA